MSQIIFIPIYMGGGGNPTCEWILVGLTAIAFLYFSYIFIDESREHWLYVWREWKEKRRSIKIQKEIDKDLGQRLLK